MHSLHGQPPQTATPGPTSSQAVTRGIRVEAHPVYMNLQVEPDGRKHVFGYRILVTNQSDQTIQILGRHWIIIDADGHRRDVEGEGVVGQQPILDPGECFEYASFCPLPTRWGTMEGAFLLQGETGKFNVTIARFYLVAEAE